MIQRILSIAFVILLSVWLFGTYKFSNENNLENKPAETQIVVDNSEATTTESSPVLVEEKKATTTKTTVMAKPVIPPQPTSTPVKIEPKPVEPTPDFEAINTFARAATVNILCTVNNNTLSPISGTGIVIDPKGVILTNAHVAQYLLLKDLYQKDFIQCVIRTGSPAYPRYNAELVYISPNWVEINKAQLKENNPHGTGENDFAFLHITGAIDGSKLPDKFPYIPPNTNDNIEIGKPVILVSYPAGFLGGLSILQGLNITSAVTTIQNIFTFKDATTDIIAVGGTVVSQKGSSGGAVVDGHSSLVGIISTSSDGNTTSSRELNAITLSYINRRLQEEADISISSLLSQDISSLAKDFQDTIAPGLVKLIKDELIK